MRKLVCLVIAVFCFRFSDKLWLNIYALNIWPVLRCTLYLLRKASNWIGRVSSEAFWNTVPSLSRYLSSMTFKIHGSCSCCVVWGHSYDDFVKFWLKSLGTLMNMMFHCVHYQANGAYLLLRTLWSKSFELRIQRFNDINAKLNGYRD